MQQVRQAAEQVIQQLEKAIYGKREVLQLVLTCLFVATLPPRDAVLAAYGRLLLALDQAGHPRPKRTTPYEHLSSLPRHLQPLAAPARTLTDLYVVVAYGDGPATAGDREGVMAALEEVRGISRGLSSPLGAGG
jgi:hypothetical protein